MVTKSPVETQRFIARIARQLQPGQVVAFSGELGSGKTTAIQALLRSFGLAGGESPTFVMMRPYLLSKSARGISEIIHVDAYRLATAREAETTGLRDVLGGSDTLVLVEWAERVRHLLPKDTIWIKMRHLGEDQRGIEVLWP